MEALGNEKPDLARITAVHSKETLYRWEEIQKNGSAELRNIIDIITGGNPPGRSITNENDHS